MQRFRTWLHDRDREGLAVPVLLCIALFTVILFALAISGVTSAAALAQSDEANTLALERAVNAVRVSYGQPERAPSSKLRTTARYWKVTYTPFAAAIDSTVVYGYVLDTVRDATFQAGEIYYSTFDMAGQWTPEQIASYWQVSAVNWWIYQTPLHTSQGCAYRQIAGQNGQLGRTQAFCIYGTENAAPTATPQPLTLPRMPTTRPLVTSTPTPRWGR